MTTQSSTSSSQTRNTHSTVREANRNETLSMGHNTLLSRILNHTPTNNQALVLEEVVDIDRQFDLYNNNQLNLIRPQVLYKTGSLNFNTQLLRINREEEVSVTTEPRNLRIISRDTIQKIKQTGKTLIHIGMIVISVKGLARKELGTKAMIMILDKRWKSDARKAVIACMEIDMSYNKGIIYCAPDFLISIKDLHELEIGIQTKGYEDFSGHANLLIGLGFLGRLTNSSTTGYKLYISSIIDALASKGVRMIKPMHISPDELEGLDWNISKNLDNEQIVIPEQGMMYKNPGDTYSLRFSFYTKRQLTDEDEASTSTSGLEKYLDA